MANPIGVEKVTGVRLLALCGDSVLIEGIEVSLRGREGVETVLVDTSQPVAIQVLDQLNPEIIIFDLNPSQLSCALTFLRTHANVVLIGLDIASDQALFLSGEWRTLPTVADLMQVIDTRIHKIQVKNGNQL